MEVLRMVDAFCASCDEVIAHRVPAEDPGSCTCTRCGTVQVMVVPLHTPAIRSFSVAEPDLAPDLLA